MGHWLPPGLSLRVIAKDHIHEGDMRIEMEILNTCPLILIITPQQCCIQVV